MTKRVRVNLDWWKKLLVIMLSAILAGFILEGLLQFYETTRRIDETGTYLDDVKVSDCSIEEYRMTETPYISVRIGIKKEAEHIGGVNIFGSHYGDHPQDILLKLHY